MPRASGGRPEPGAPQTLPEGCGGGKAGDGRRPPLITEFYPREFYPRGENGFHAWAAPKQDWTVATQRDGDQWCVHRIAVTYRAGFDPAGQTLTYGGGGLISGAPGGTPDNAPGAAGDDDTIGGGIQGEAHR